MTPPLEKGAPRVELYVREALPRPAEGRRADVLGALTTLETQGQIENVDLTSWPAKVPSRDASAARDRYDAFTRWAREAGVRLGPSFDTRECYGMETGERATWLVLPALCLAVYGDEGLRAVYPHADGGNHYTVMDGLAHLRGTERRGESATGPAALEPAD